MPGSTRKAAMIKPQKQWEEWAAQRIADAEKIAKQYKAEGKAIQKMLADQGCDCDPLIVLGMKGNSPDTSSPSVTHTFECQRS